MKEPSLGAAFSCLDVVVDVASPRLRITNSLVARMRNSLLIHRSQSGRLELVESFRT